MLFTKFLACCIKNETWLKHFGKLRLWAILILSFLFYLRAECGSKMVQMNLIRWYNVNFVLCSYELLHTSEKLHVFGLYSRCGTRKNAKRRQLNNVIIAPSLRLYNPLNETSSIFVWFSSVKISFFFLLSIDCIFNSIYRHSPIYSEWVIACVCDVHLVNPSSR